MAFCGVSGPSRGCPENRPNEITMSGSRERGVRRRGQVVLYPNSNLMETLAGLNDYEH